MVKLKLSFSIGLGGGRTGMPALWLVCALGFFVPASALHGQPAPGEVPRAIPVAPSGEGQDEDLADSQPPQTIQLPENVEIRRAERVEDQDGEDDRIDELAPEDVSPEEDGSVLEAPAGDDASAEERVFSGANGMYANQLWELAFDQYVSYLKQFPQGSNRAAAYYRAGESALKMGDEAQARKLYEGLLGEFEKGDFFGRAAFRLGEFYYRDGDFEGALPMFRRAAAQMEDEKLVLTARFKVGRALEKLGRPGEAKYSYREVTEGEEDTPYSDLSRLALARILIRSGEKEEALKAFEELIQDENIDQEVRSDSVLEAGLIAAELGQADKAVTYLEEVLKNPGLRDWHAQAAQVIMQLLYAQREFQKVIERYDQYSQVLSGNQRVELLTLTAKAHRRLGKNDEASKILLTIFENYPNSPQAPEAEYQYLLSLYQMGEDNLVPRIDRFLSKRPPQEWQDRAYLLKAEILFLSEKYEEAAYTYSSIIGSQLPEAVKAQASYRQAWCFLKLEELPEAVRRFNEFIKTYPDHEMIPQAMLQRAQIYLREEKLEFAVKDYTRLIEDYPEAGEARESALYNRALIQGQQENTKGMIDSFRQLLREYPETEYADKANWYKAKALYELGEASEDAEHLEEAIEAFRQAAKLAEEAYGENARLFIIRCLYQLERVGQLAQEIEDYYAVERTFQVPVDILIWVGKTYLDQERYELAQRFFGLAKSNNRFDPSTPAHANMLRDLTITQLRLGEFDQALETIDTFAEGQKENRRNVAEAHLHRAWAYIGQGEYSKAMDETDETIRLYPSGTLNGEALIMKGNIHFASGDFCEAAKRYASVVLTYLDPRITPEAMHRAAKAYELCGDRGKAESIRGDLAKEYPSYKYEAGPLDYLLAPRQS